MVYIGLIIQWTNIGLSYPKGRFIAGPVMVAQWKSWRTIIKNTFIVITEAYKLCFLGLRVKISIARPTINWPYLWQIPMLYKCSSSLHAPPPYQFLFHSVKHTVDIPCEFKYTFTYIYWLWQRSGLDGKVRPSPLLDTDIHIYIFFYWFLLVYYKHSNFAAKGRIAGFYIYKIIRIIRK